MIPNMFKIAGELTPTVFHVAARALATHALSIFGDHSDVMAARTTGWAMLASASVQEAHDLALISPCGDAESPRAVPALLRRLPHLARGQQDRACSTTTTSAPCSRRRSGRAHRARGLTPDAPVLRGTAQNPDVFFQAREAATPSTSPCRASSEDAWTVRRAHRPALPPVRLRGRTRRRARGRAHGLGLSVRAQETVETLTRRGRARRPG